MVSPSIRINIPAKLKHLAPVKVNDLIRLGNKRDGGYVVPKTVLLNLDAHLFFGVGNDWSFEQDLLKQNPSIIIHGYDHTVSEKTYIMLCLECVAKFLFFSGSVSEIRSQIATYRSYKKFFNSKALHFEERVFNRIDTTYDTTIDKIISRVAGKHNISIKMDIEGGEYRVIDDILKHHNKVNLLVIEFHDTDPFREIFLQKIQNILEFYHIVHLHANNFGDVSIDNFPEAVEISFLHKNLMMSDELEYRNQLPIKDLDFPNNPLRSDYEIFFLNESTRA